MGDEPLVPCSTSSGQDRFEPIPYSQAERLASLVSGGTAVEPPPSLGTTGVVADPPTPTGTVGAVVDPPAPLALEARW